MRGHELLTLPSAIDRKPIFVVYGDDEFLRGAAVAAVRAAIFGDDPNPTGISEWAGEDANAADVLDELCTIPLFAQHRLAIVRDSEKWVTRFRETIEAYAEAPAALGTLLLISKSWNKATRLARVVQQKGTAIECRPLTGADLQAWCREWAKTRHGLSLTAASAKALVGIVGNDLAALDMEFQKLAAAGDAVAPALIEQLAAPASAPDIWPVIDLALDGKLGSALAGLIRILEGRVQPLELFGALAWRLRRLAQIARLVREEWKLNDAMRESGVYPGLYASTESQLRRLGAARLRSLPRWLLETDLALKGEGRESPRAVLERLFVRIGQPAP